MDKHLHIVSLRVPYPSDFGGVFDIYHKMVALHSAGVKIHLHCFSEDMVKQPHLEQFCVEINHYKRRTGLSGVSLTRPYIVSSRNSRKLTERLKRDDYPILLEGIHCTSVLSDAAFLQRRIFLRLHNVEHLYYRGLMAATGNLFEKTYFAIESYLLKKHENRIASLPIEILSVSHQDEHIYKNEFAAAKVRFLPVFTGWVPDNKAGAGEYCLYHGNLAVPENEKAAVWLIEEVFSPLSVSLVIAGKKPSTRLKKLAQLTPRVKLLPDPGDDELNQLIADAQINVLPSFNNTGVKLKVIHALFKGRYCIANSAAVAGSGLEGECIIADSSQQFQDAVTMILHARFTEEQISKRRAVLGKLYDDGENCDALIRSIW